ncbi:MAG: PaaI family thioesterase [Proteobacteria bacterium]|nr:PaaI family thioesterase [Pseudomonadota bacterium]
MNLSTDEIARINDNPLYRVVGIFCEQAGAGQAQCRLTPNPEVCWPSPGRPHGGILFTLMDTTSAWAVMSTLADRQDCATIQLDIQYLAAASGDRFTCGARVVRRTRALGFTTAEIFDDQDRLLAVGQGTFKVLGDLPSE